MFRDHVAVHIAQLMGVVHLHVRTCTRADVAPFPYLGNGWTDCAEMWYVVRYLLARRFTEVDDGIQLHVRTYASIFRISGTAARIALKLRMWL